MSSLQAISKLNYNNFTVIANDGGTYDWSLGCLISSKQVKRLIVSYIGENKQLQEQYLKGEIEVELTPLGTLAEKLRCGAMGT